eukprot:134111_1
MGYSEANPSWLKPVTIILLLLNYLILLPSALRFIKSTWSIRYETYMKSRQLHITVIFAVSLLTIIIIHPILLCLYFWSLDIPNNINKIIDIIIHTLVIILSIIPLIGIACRSWLFYYAHKYTEAIFKEKRIGLQLEKKEELINNINGETRNRQSVSPFVSTPKSPQTQLSYDDVNTNKLKSLNLQEMDRGISHTKSTMASIGSLSPTGMTNASAEDIIKMESTLINPLQFYINHRQTLGSFRFVKYICIILYIFDIIIITICVSIMQIFTSYVIQSIIFIILFIFVQFHVYKLSPFRDEFFVRKQFKTEMKIIYLNLFLWIICFIVWYFIESKHIYNNNELQIAIRLLLDTNMTLTSFLLIVAQFAVPMFRFEEGIDTLSNRNVLITSKDKSKRLKISLNECIKHHDGYYLFLEYLMKEFSVENLLFLTEVAYMKQKFEKTVIIQRNKSDSNSVASSIKNAFVALSDRKRSTESSISNDNPDNNTKIKHQPTSLRLKKLRDIPSDDAIVTTQSEVENIMNKSANELIEENELYTNDIIHVKSDSDSEQSESDKKRIVEMGVINGKRLTISMDMLKSRTTVTIINDKNKHTYGKMALPKLPHTLTMAESMKQNNLFDSVDMIYDNFIDKNAQYQINISSNTRGHITQIVIKHRQSIEAQREKLKSLDIDHGGVIPSGLSGIIVDINVFDDALNEIISLLRSSFYRFAQTKQYKIYCNAMSK